MTVVHSIDTSKYDPISHGSNYLYNQFDRIQSFLIKQNADRYRNVLAKPVLTNGQVLWYANFDQPFSRLTELSEEKQINIKAKYWEVRQHIDAEIQQLSLSKDVEKRNWASLLKDVFNEDDNVILSDGENWCLLWGWKFRNLRENYLSPEFMPKPLPLAPLVDRAQPRTSGQGVAASSLTPLVDDGRVPIVPVTRAAASIKKTRFWDRLKRFLRRLVYRLWGLMLLIMFILFLACLFKTCQNRRMRESCQEMDQLNKKLIDLDKKVQDRCLNKNK